MAFGRSPMSFALKARRTADASRVFPRLVCASGLMSGNKLALLGALFFLLVFVVQGIFFIRANSQTLDEATHLAAGYSYLATRDFRLDPEHPSFVKELQALPLFLVYGLPFNPNSQHWRDGDSDRIGLDFLYKSIIPADQMLFWSRLPNLLLGALLVALIGRWAYRLWGSLAAILAMALASFEPNLVAHSSLVTTDLGVGLFIFLTLYLLWEYLNRPTWTRLAAIGFSTGMALVSKFSSLLLIAALGLIIALPILVGGEPCVLPSKEKKQIEPWQKIVQAGALFLLILLFAFLVIPPAYLFQGFSPWLYGLHDFLTHAQSGHLAFFLGEYSYQGWWYYFPVTFLIKTPIGSLMLIAASLVFYRAGSPLETREALLLLLLPVLILISTTQAKVNIGLRHILPVYPFLFVLSSRLATVRFERRWLAPFLIGVPLTFTAMSSFRIIPHQLAYFNEIVGGPDQGYRYLSDSNLDWGQDLKGVKAYMDKEDLPLIYFSYFGTAPPSYYGIRYQDVAGTGIPEQPPPGDKVPVTAPRKILAISVYNLQDVSRPDHPLFRWLWVRQPVAKIGYSIFIYDLTNDQEGLMKLEETYAKAGTTLAP
jgi:Dolichyl-phosphate-mannose-protein mannosyltransferase